MFGEGERERGLSFLSHYPFVTTALFRSTTRIQTQLNCLLQEWKSVSEWVIVNSVSNWEIESPFSCMTSLNKRGKWCPVEFGSCAADITGLLTRICSLSCSHVQIYTWLQNICSFVFMPDVLLCFQTWCLNFCWYSWTRLLFLSLAW